jgi:pimeloyl-ACP methyl ester carboxylesterase
MFMKLILNAIICSETQNIAALQFFVNFETEIFPLDYTPMRKAAFFIIVLLFTLKAFAQAEPANYITIVTKFKQFYNNNQPDSIFGMFSPEFKIALPLDKFKPTTEQLKSQYGELVKTDFVKYGGSLAVYKATFKNSVFLLNVSLNAQNKLTGLLLSPYQENAAANGVIDPSITESPVLLKTLSGSISGTLVMPKNVNGKIPVVLIIGDAGPTDRDGNNAKLDIAANTYKLLAYDLGKNGIASLRYDKRMVGESVSTTKESQLRIDDYGDDAVSLINMLNDDQRFSKIILFGHGEGALVAMLAMFDEPVKAYISAEGAGEQADKILTEQMKSRPRYQADEFKGILDSLKKGKSVPNVDPSLYYIAGPNRQTFLMSWCRIVPERGIKKIKLPVLIIQGTTDLSVPTENGEKLKKAKSDATYLPIKGMNHVLKDAPADEEQNLATYSKPDLPLSAALVPGIVEFVNKVK